MEDEPKTNQEIEIREGKIVVTTITKTKFKKVDDLTYGNQVISFKDLGDSYEREVISTESFDPHAFLRMVTSIRQKKDQLLVQKKTYDEYENAMNRFEPFIKQARELQNNPVVSDEVIKYEEGAEKNENRSVGTK